MRVNGLKTNWFSVNCGLKQGCNLSTLLLNLFINDLVDTINLTNIGIDIDGESVAALLYADDLVLLATSEQDLQTILNVLNDWCDKNRMTINEDKSNVVHFRTPSMERTNHSFTCFSFFFFLYILPHALADILGRLAQRLLVSDRKS